MEIATGMGFSVKRNEIAADDHFIGQFLVLCFGSVAPVNIIRLGQFCNLVHPGIQLLVGGHAVFLLKDIADCTAVCVKVRRIDSGPPLFNELNQEFRGIQDFVPGSGRDQRINHVFDIRFIVFTAQTGCLLLPLELQKAQVNRVGEPCLMHGFAGFHTHFLKRGG